MSAEAGPVPTPAAVATDATDPTRVSAIATDAPPVVVEDDSFLTKARRLVDLATIGRLLLALGGALVLFAVLMLLKGTNPITAYSDMLRSTLTDRNQLGGIVVKATPIILAALAVAVPARGGLINVGGEGQLIMGGVAAMGVSLASDGRIDGPLALVLMGLAAAVAGGLWSALAAVLRRAVGIAESVTTLLLNYIALDLMFFLIYDRWKDRQGSGQPATRPVGAGERLPLLGDTRVHVGIFIAIVATLLVFVVMRSSTWGFRLRVVGGNAEAARRAGLDVNRILITSMFIGGALAGIGGFCQLAGAEFKLRSGFIVGYGYIAFLGSWLARHRAIGVAFACLLLSAVSIGGDSLQLDSGLPAASVNVLMALLLLGVFGFGRKKAVSA